jgi:plastocyanin
VTIALAVGTLSSTVADVQEGVGVIQGFVRTAAARGAATLPVTADHRVCGQTVPNEELLVDGAGGVANAVVIVAGTTGGAAGRQVTLTNRNCAFAPRVLVAPPKTSMTVTSDDDLLHNTHAYDERDYTIFNVALPGPGLRIRRPLQDSGVVSVKCDVHQWMRGYVIVTDELAAVTASSGAFEIGNVPAGTHRVRVWHEGLGAPPQSVTVAAGRTTRLEFVLSR